MYLVLWRAQMAWIARSEPVLVWQRTQLLLSSGEHRLLASFVSFVLIAVFQVLIITPVARVFGLLRVCYVYRFCIDFI